MSKGNLSQVEKKLIRILFIFIFLQIIIIMLFIRISNESRTIDIKETKQIDVTVEDVLYFKALSEYRLTVYSDSTRFVFTSSGTFEEYPVSKLYETISVGDRLSLIYYESDSVFGKVNIVVDARTETEIYRSFEEYNRGKEGLTVVVFIIFFVIELFFCGVVILFFWYNINIIKGFCRKVNRRIKTG